MTAHATLMTYAQREQWSADTLLLVTAGYLAECVPGAAPADTLADAALAMAERAKLPCEALAAAFAATIDLYARDAASRAVQPWPQFLEAFAQATRKPVIPQVSRTPQGRTIFLAISPEQARQIQVWLAEANDGRVAAGTVLASVQGVCDTEPTISAHLAVVAGAVSQPASLVLQLRQGRSVVAQVEDHCLSGDYTLIGETAGAYSVKITPF